MENEVKVLKLITGDEIVAMMTARENESVILENPMKIRWDATDPKRISLELWSVVATTDQITLESKNILAILEPTSQTIENYLGAVADVEGNNSRPYSGSGGMRQGITSGSGSGAPTHGLGT